MKLRIHNLFPLLGIAVASLMLAACATYGQHAGQSITIQTGRVVAAQSVNLQSQAGRGVAVGGILGYVATSSRHGSSRRVRNTILGAAAGGVIAASAEGSLNGMEFTVEVGSGALVQVVTDQTEIQVGDCVNVEQAGRGTANVRRVSKALCEAVASNTVDTDIQKDISKSAQRCLVAKERLLDAESDAQIEAAIRRVEILCDD
jgi:outer membrane lipoprotein SlyB